jgi:hypothetical protein
MKNDSIISVYNLSDLDRVAYYEKHIESLKKAEAERQQKEIEEVRIEAERIEREKREAERIEREKIQRELENERKQKQELENELKKKREAEELEAKRIREQEIREQERQESLKKLPVKNQLNEWVSSFDIQIPDGLENDVTANDILTKFWSFKSWAKQQIEKI